MWDSIAPHGDICHSYILYDTYPQNDGRVKHARKLFLKNRREREPMIAELLNNPLTWLTIAVVWGKGIDYVPCIRKYWSHPYWDQREVWRRNGSETALARVENEYPKAPRSVTTTLIFFYCTWIPSIGLAFATSLAWLSGKKIFGENWVRPGAWAPGALFILTLILFFVGLQLHRARSPISILFWIGGIVTTLINSHLFVSLIMK